MASISLKCYTHDVVHASEDAVIESSGSKSIRIFISHSSFDKIIAGRVKYTLETFFGFEVFVAHEDIEPASVWDEKILEELEATDIVIALFTENFKASKFADQECGYALALKKYIIPIKISTDPYGFLGRLQALQFKLYADEIIHWIDFCKKLVKVISDHEPFSEKIVDLQIKALKNSYNFDTTKKIVRLLREVISFTEAQVNDILKAYLTNNQVSSEAFEAPYFIKNLIAKYKKKMDRSLLLQFHNTIS